MKAVKNIPASVRQKLLNHSRERGERFTDLLLRFGIERLLYRIARSRYSDRFLLKGAMLFAVWNDNVPHRPSRDLDLLGFGPSEQHEIKSVFRHLCGMNIEPDDGLIFDPDSIMATSLRAIEGYGGTRIKLSAALDGARIGIQVDVVFGGVVTPAPEIVIYPVLLPGLPPPVIRAYPIYTVAAEKAAAMVQHGMKNDRMKDFYDLWFLSHKFVLDHKVLREAIRRTFERNQIPLPSGVPPGLTPDFAAAKTALWQAFLSRNGLREPAGSFSALLEQVRIFLAPVL